MYTNMQYIVQVFFFIFTVGFKILPWDYWIIIILVQVDESSQAVFLALQYYCIIFTQYHNLIGKLYALNKVSASKLYSLCDIYENNSTFRHNPS